MTFDGATYDEARDGERLARQMGRVRAVMGDGAWHTLPEIASLTGYPEASISARLRDLRKAKFGGHVVERRFAGHGLWQYRVVGRDETPLEVRLPW